jgi:hypothetical protein
VLVHCDFEDFLIFHVHFGLTDDTSKQTISNLLFLLTLETKGACLRAIKHWLGAFHLTLRGNQPLGAGSSAIAEIHR